MPEISDSNSFAKVLPSAMQRYAPALLQAGQQYGVSPWLLAGVLWRETNAGTVLTPPGAAGTGDWTPRHAGSRYFAFANPVTGMPPDGLGWGRGLMQLDYGAEHAWVTTHDWADPLVNIGYAALKLAGLVVYFGGRPGVAVLVDQWRLTGYPTAHVAGWLEKYGLASTGPYPDPRPLQGAVLDEAALSAYNAGIAGVLQAAAAGLPPSAPTAHNDYGSWILEHISAWKAALPRV